MATQNSEKLTWDEICQRYDQQWVELVDYDWPETEPYPHAGIVRVHAASRRVFDDLILHDAPDHSAFVFVGERKTPPGVILSANLHQWRAALK